MGSGGGESTAKIGKSSNTRYINTSTPSSGPGVGTSGDIWNYRISGVGEPATIVGCLDTYPKRINISKNNNVAIKKLNNKNPINDNNSNENNSKTKTSSIETINNNKINIKGRNKYCISRINKPNSNNDNNNNNSSKLGTNDYLNRDIQSLSRHIPDHLDQSPRFRNKMNIYPHDTHEEVRLHSQGDHSGKGQFHHSHNKYKPGQRCQYLSGYPDYGGGSDVRPTLNQNVRQKKLNPINRA